MGKRVISQELAELGNRIREQRQILKLSQETLAEIAGISPNTVSRIEGGQTAMSVEIFQRLVKILRLDPNELLIGSSISRMENRKLKEIFQRAWQLQESQQKVLIKTMGVLIDALERDG